MHYTQLTYDERRCIAEILESEPDASRSAIARRLGRSKSTICDEILRNSRQDGKYLGSEAEERARFRKYRRRGAYKKDNPYLLEAIEEQLQDKWSPEIIAAKLKEKYPDDRRFQISHQTIYELIRENRTHGGDWYTKLPQGNRKRRKRYGSREKRGSIKNRVGIEERPKIVEAKTRIGDWEGDSIEGCKGGGGLVSLVDRRTQFTILEKLQDGTATALNRASIRGVNRHGELPLLTMTVDNGKEFAFHEALAEKLGLDIYFARPYHAWERGLNEQVNGMVRWWFPKGTNFHRVTRAEVRYVERLLNNRPRKKLGYRTPAEVMQQAFVRLQI